MSIWKSPSKKNERERGWRGKPGEREKELISNLTGFFGLCFYLQIKLPDKVREPLRTLSCALSHCNLSPYHLHAGRPTGLLNKKREMTAREHWNRRQRKTLSLYGCLNTMDADIYLALFFLPSWDDDDDMWPASENLFFLFSVPFGFLASYPLGTLSLFTSSSLIPRGWDDGGRIFEICSICKELVLKMFKGPHSVAQLNN